MGRHKIRLFFRKLFRVPYWRPNKQSRKMLREEADKLIGWDKEVNPTWSKSWKYFIKRQYPWSGLLELNQYKIIEMRDYMINHSTICEEGTEKQIKEMTEVIELGNKILADEYEYTYMKWHKTNTIPVVLIYEKLGEKFLGNSTNIKVALEGKLLDKLYDRNIFDDLIVDLDLGLDCGITKDDLKQNQEWLKGKQTCSLNEWLKENNLTKDKITCAYSSEFTNGKSDEENQKYGRELLQQCYQDRRNDIIKYFECIGEYMDGWGD